MTLRKITIDKSLRYVSKDNPLHCEQSLPFSSFRKKNFSTNEDSHKKKKFLKTITRERFTYNKRLANCYF